MSHRGGGEDRDVVIHFQPRHERVGRPLSAPHHQVKKMSQDEERIKVRMALRALDERDLESNIVNWLKHVAIQGTEGATKLLLTELFHGLDSSNVNGRKQRFRLARHLVTTSAYVEIQDTVPAIVRTLVRRASEEKSHGLYEEEAKFLTDLTDSALTLAHAQAQREQREQEGGGGGGGSPQSDAAGTHHAWVHHTLAKPFLDVTCKTLDARKIAGCCRYLHAVLCACALSTHIDLDISLAMAREVLRKVHRFFHQHRATARKVPELFLVQEKCVEVVQLDLTPREVESLVECFASSVENKDNWQVRKAGLEMATTVSTVFVDAPRFPGDSESREVLRKYMGVIQGCLDKARYDKIVHVRKAMQKAQAAFNGIELVPFDDGSYAERHMEEVGQRYAERRQQRGKPLSARRRFTRPKGKIGDDFGIQIFVPMEDESEEPQEAAHDSRQGGERAEDQGDGDGDGDGGFSAGDTPGSDAAAGTSSPSRGAPWDGQAAAAGSPPQRGQQHFGEQAGPHKSFVDSFDDMGIREQQQRQPQGSVGGIGAGRGASFAEDSLAAVAGAPGGPERLSVSHHTLESLVAIHAQEIEKFYRDKEKAELARLREKFERHLRKLQEAFERDTGKVKAVIQNAIDKEVDFFKRDRLPKLAKLLSDKQAPAPDHP